MEAASRASTALYWENEPSFWTLVHACDLDTLPGTPDGWGTQNVAKWLLWEDPVFGHLAPQVGSEYFRSS